MYPEVVLNMGLTYVDIFPVYMKVAPYTIGDLFILKKTFFSEMIRPQQWNCWIKFKMVYKGRVCMNWPTRTMMIPQKIKIKEKFVCTCSGKGNSWKNVRYPNQKLFDVLQFTNYLLIVYFQLLKIAIESVQVVCLISTYSLLVSCIVSQFWIMFCIILIACFFKILEKSTSRLEKKGVHGSEQHECERLIETGVDRGQGLEGIIYREDIVSFSKLVLMILSWYIMCIFFMVCYWRGWI